MAKKKRDKNKNLLKKVILSKDISSAKTDPNFFSMLQELENPETILRKMNKTQKFYENLFYDPHVMSQVRPLKSGLTNYKYEIMQANDDPASIRSAELTRHVMLMEPNKNEKWSDILYHLYSANMRGMAVLNIRWKFENGVLLPDMIKSWTADRFTFNAEHDLRLITRDNPSGEVVDDYRWLISKHMSSSDNPFGIALLSCCVWPYIFKTSGFKYFVKLCEKYGVPFPIARYPKGSPPEVIDEIEDAMFKLVEDSFAVFPEGTAIEILKGATTGEAPQERLINLCNSEISKAISSSTLTTEIQGQGSRAATTEHGEKSKENEKADRETLVANTMNTLFKWIHELNFTTGEPAQFIFKDEKKISTETVERVQRTATIMPVKKTWAYQQLGCPIPEDGDDTIFLGVEPDAPDSSSTDFSAFRATDESLDFDAVVSDMVNKIKDVLNEPDNLSDILEMIKTGLPGVSPDALKELFGQELAADYLSGMSESAND